MKINDDDWIGALGDNAEERNNSTLARELYELARKINPAEEEWWRRLNLCRLTMKSYDSSYTVYIDGIYWRHDQTYRVVEAGKYYTIEIYRNNIRLPEKVYMRHLDFLSWRFDAFSWIYG